jgi:quercetin dioxygenase-like cupin family protein
MSQSKVVARSDADSYWQPVPANGYIDILLKGTDTASGRVSMGTQTVAPGSFVREHAHPTQEELIFVIEGEGIAELDGVEHPMTRGTLFYLAPRSRHKFTNTGVGDLTFTWTMVPSGLEEFFPAVGRARKAGDPAPAPFPRPADVKQIELGTVFVDLSTQK